MSFSWLDNWLRALAALVSFLRAIGTNDMYVCGKANARLPRAVGLTLTFALALFYAELGKRLSDPDRYL